MAEPIGYEVKDHFLFVNDVPVKVKPSPNHGREMVPTLIVIHYTGDNSCQGAVSWLTSRGSGVSAHLVVDKTGTIYQLLPFNVVGWHAGKSEYNGKPSVNAFSIGIENVGLGLSWPDAQVEANRAIIEVLYATYPIEDCVGHEDVAIPEGRKVDPGPRYPWDRVVKEA